MRIEPLLPKVERRFRYPGRKRLPDRQALQGIAKAGIAGFSRSELAKLHVHALVVWGAKDGVDSVSSGRETARQLHARFVLIPGAGHLSMTEAPVAIARAIG